LSVTHHFYAEGVSAISRRSSAANTAGIEQQKVSTTKKVDLLTEAMIARNWKPQINADEQK